MSNTTLAVKGTEQASRTQIMAREFAQRLKYMIVNGSKLQDNEVYALAQYASATGLDPFANECWYIPGKGPGPGIAGWRKKAQEQLEYEAKDAKEDGAHYWTEFSEATPGDCVFDASKGDIAYVAVLRDSVSQHRWRKSVIEASNDFMKMGAKFDQALKEAKELVGKEPIWIGNGVVFGAENFGASEKFDRKERARKRAEKLAIRKRFPRIHLPEPEGIDDVVEAGNYSIDVEAIQTRSVDENIKALGYSDEPAIESKIEKPAKGYAVMTFKRACEIKGSNNTKYGNCTNEELEGKRIGILAALKKGDTDPVKQSQYEEKLEAIKVLLTVPESERLERAGQISMDLPDEGSAG